VKRWIRTLIVLSGAFVVLNAVVLICARVVGPEPGKLQPLQAVTLDHFITPETLAATDGRLPIPTELVRLVNSDSGSPCGLDQVQLNLPPFFSIDRASPFLEGYTWKGVTFFGLARAGWRLEVMVPPQAETPPPLRSHIVVSINDAPTYRIEVNVTRTGDPSQWDRRSGEVLVQWSGPHRVPSTDG